MFREVVESFCCEVKLVAVVAERASFTILVAETDAEFHVFSFEVEAWDFGVTQTKRLVNVNLNENADSLDFSRRVAVSCSVSVKTASGSLALVRLATSTTTSSSLRIGVSGVGVCCGIVLT